MVPNESRLVTVGMLLRPRARDGLILLACVVAAGLYLVQTGMQGFPLDDAWIHQTYARNLAESGQWAFVPGQPSTGSTSVLWTLLVTPGYRLPLNPFAWTHLAGLAALAAAALGAARLAGDGSPVLALAAGLAVALEWHLAWAATSGMETALFAALMVWFWVWMCRRDPALLGHRWQDGLLLGVWGGVLMLARPEGVLALGVAGLYGLLAPRTSDGWRLEDRLRWAACAGAGFALVLGPFMAFNVALSGAVWPNTFYAKQAEYAVLWARPFPLRLLDQASVSFVGGQALLIPGLLALLWRRLRERPTRWTALLPLVWVGLHWALYALRLPVTYQHGRYAIPTIPVLVACGVVGMAELLRLHDRRWPVRVGSRAWLLATAALFPVVLAVLGAPAYGRDVAFIEGEMVATARWVEQNVPQDSTIAAHDIGALGYYAPRRLIDLAGLVSPEIIPFMHDPGQLEAHLVISGAGYLIVFPHWSVAYADLASRPAFTPVWSAAAEAGYTGASQLGPMTVYRVASGEGGR